MECSLLVQEFEEIPSSDEFSARIEPRNAPAVFRRCVEDWIALTSWNPSTGGLEYLQDTVGSSVVEAMVSSSAPIFYGDIRRHERVEVAFSTFIGLCKQHSHSKDEPKVPHCESDDPKPDDEDSSSIIEVVLWPPSASPLLYLMPIYSEASNHSSVALDRPDFSTYPRSRLAAGYSQKITLREGDALFIPEGWFHQVDSDDLTIAVNFWWRSDIMSSMIGHMDAYYLRRLLRRLIDKEMNQMLQQSSAGGSLDRTLTSNVSTSDNCEDNKVPGNKAFCGSLSWNVGLDDLAPPAIWALHKLISLVHDQVNPTDRMEESTFSADPACNQSKGCVKLEVANMYNLDNDPVAKILWNLDALTLQAMLLVMVNNFPRTLEALILHLLSPVGAEALTRKFDEMDKKMDEDDRSKFYQHFYSIFGDHFSAADLILRRKESFAHQAFKNVLDLHMGVHIDGQIPCMGERLEC